MQVTDSGIGDRRQKQCQLLGHCRPKQLKNSLATCNTELLLHSPTLPVPELTSLLLLVLVRELVAQLLADITLGVLHTKESTTMVLLSSTHLEGRTIQLVAIHSSISCWFPLFS